MSTSSSFAPRRSARRPRVLIADDHEMLAEAFERLLAAEFDVVGRVADGLELLKVAPRLRPDLVVLDAFVPNVQAHSTDEDQPPGTRHVKQPATRDPDPSAFPPPTYAGARADQRTSSCSPASTRARSGRRDGSTSTIAKGRLLSHAPRVKSGTSTDVDLLATESQLKGTTALHAAAS